MNEKEWKDILCLFIRLAILLTSNENDCKKKCYHCMVENVELPEIKENVMDLVKRLSRAMDSVNPNVSIN